MTDGKLEKVEDATKYHIEDYDTTFCLEVKATQKVDAGTYLVKANNEAGDVEAEFKLSVESMLDHKLSLPPLPPHPSLSFLC